VEQETHGDEDQIVDIQIQRGHGPSGDVMEDVNDVSAEQEAHYDRQERAVFQPFSRF